MTTCPDCDREMFGDRCPCGYTKAARGGTFRNTYTPTPQGITKEQFGLPLFGVIELCGGILQLQEMQEMERVRESGRVEDYHKREVLLARELADVFTRLSAPEQAQLMRRYPKLFGRRMVAV